MKILVEPSKLSSGIISVAGFKHLAVPILAASVFADSRVELQRVPRITDILVMIELLENLGGRCTWTGESLSLDFNSLRYGHLDSKLTVKAHGPLYLIPALLGKFGRSCIIRTGGCPIGDPKDQGARPIKHVLEILKRFGGQYDSGCDQIVCCGKNLHPAEIDISEFSEHNERLTGPLLSGATKTAIIIALSIKNGTTVIHNPYLKMDVIGLLDFVQLMGYSIVWENESVRISRVTVRNNIFYQLPYDYIEIMTWIALSVYCNINVQISNISLCEIYNGMAAEIKAASSMGISFEENVNGVTICPPSVLLPVNIDVIPCGIYSDSHPFFTLMALCASGPSQIVEYVWPNRFAYLQNLERLGGKFKLLDNKLIIYPSCLKSSQTDLLATDLRDAAVSLLAALKLGQPTVINRADHLLRGYHSLLEKLCSLGAKVSLED